MKYRLVLACGGLMAVGALAASPAAPPNLHALMKNVVAVQAQIIWDTGNLAMDGDGNPDASKLTAADWNRIGVAAAKVKESSQALASAEHVLAAAPGQKLQDEGNPGALDAKAVQRLIDSNPKAFSAFATAMAASMDGLAAAARAGSHEGQRYIRRAGPDLRAVPQAVLVSESVTPGSSLQRPNHRPHLDVRVYNLPLMKLISPRKLSVAINNALRVSSSLYGKL